jgi:hypothetical protein
MRKSCESLDLRKRTFEVEEGKERVEIMELKE